MGQRVKQGISVLQDWVMMLPLRHQGVLISAVRGCDTAVRHDASKMFARCLRAAILHAAVERPTSFIDFVSDDVLRERMDVYLNNWDHYPQHYNMHVVHAAAIIAYYGPTTTVHTHAWGDFYKAACRKLHLKPESIHELEERLCADEEFFHAAQDSKVSRR